MPTLKFKQAVEGGILNLSHPITFQWKTDTDYEVEDIVFNENHWYECLTSHKSKTLTEDKDNWRDVTPGIIHEFYKDTEPVSAFKHKGFYVDLKQDVDGELLEKYKAGFPLLQGDNIISFPGNYRLDISGAGGYGGYSGLGYNGGNSWSTYPSGPGGNGGNGYTASLTLNLKHTEILSVVLGTSSRIKTSGTTTGVTKVTKDNQLLLQANGGGLGGNGTDGGTSRGRAGANGAGGNGAAGGAGGPASEYSEYALKLGPANPGSSGKPGYAKLYYLGVRTS